MKLNIIYIIKIILNISMIDVFDRKTATPANEVHFSLYWILYITFIGFRIFSIIRIFRKKNHYVTHSE